MTKTVLNIPHGAPFLDTLACHVWDEAGGDGLALSRYLILLPTRRSCRQLGAAFARVAAGRATLLPRLQPLGDADEDDLAFADMAGGASGLDIPPAIAPLRRLMLLTRAVQARDATLSLDQAARAADALAGLLDEIEREEADPAALPGLVETQELAIHWQETVTFLDIILREWPAILAEQGCIDQAARRRRVLDALAGAWAQMPPAHPVIAAGAVGSTPASRRLLDVIAGLPQGRVVLSGLDGSLDDAAWDAVADSHPQGALKILLAQMGVGRAAVRDLATTPVPARLRLLTEAARPAATTDAWRGLRGELDAAATHGLGVVTADHAQEEAQIIALALRAWLQDAGAAQTAALVTTDRGLAARVAAALRRWTIAVDDSAGQSLDRLPPGVFLNLVMAAAAPQAGSVDRLALLKHPLAACGMDPAACRAAARATERLLREGAPADFARLDRLSATMRADWHRPLQLDERIAQHIAVATAIAAADAQDGAARLWHGEAGEQAATWLAEWRAASAGMPALAGGDYAALFADLSARQPVRSVRASHAQIAILGQIEARLLAPDFVILGALNEGQWPPDAGYDPWMSRPMRKAFGLSAPEARIGTAARDFDALAAAPSVLLTRAARAKGSPTVASRFLLQIDAVLRAAGLVDGGAAPLATATHLRDWARAIDRADITRPWARPAPCPPVGARPKALPVTDIGLWRRNPYGLYAKRILGLRRLADLDTPPGAADKGVLLHAAMERFVGRFPDTLPADAAAQLLAIGADLLAQDDPRVRTFWTRQLETIAAWFVDTERARRAAGVKTIAVEAKGEIMLDAFRLHGRADRIDRLTDGMLAIVDYKTGKPTTKTAVASGYEPQLALLALIAQAGGFKTVPAEPVGALEHWNLKGGRTGSDISRIAGDVADLAAHAGRGVRDLAARFAEAATVYHATPIARLGHDHDDYAHLARTNEWGRGGGDA